MSVLSPPMAMAWWPWVASGRGTVQGSGLVEVVAGTVFSGVGRE